MAISSSSVVSRVPGVLATDVAGQRVLLSEELRYLGLDRTGEAVWELLETPRTFDDLVDELVRRFDVSQEQCRSDVSDFLADLEKRHVVTIG